MYTEYPRTLPSQKVYKFHEGLVLKSGGYDDCPQQHDSAFKGIMNLILSHNCVLAIAGVEIAKSPLRGNLVIERFWSAPHDRRIVAQLVNHLPPLIIYEFKGPSDALQDEHLWRLVSYCGLDAEERRLSFFKPSIAAMIIYVGISERRHRLIRAYTKQISLGVMRYTPLGNREDGDRGSSGDDKSRGVQLIVVRVNHLPLSPSPKNRPFLLFREEDVEQILDMILRNPRA